MPRKVTVSSLFRTLSTMNINSMGTQELVSTLRRLQSHARLLLKRGVEARLKAYRKQQRERRRDVMYGGR